MLDYYEVKFMLKIRNKCQLPDFIAQFMYSLTKIQSEGGICIWISKIMWNSLLTSTCSWSLWNFLVKYANYFAALCLPNHNDSYYKSKSKKKKKKSKSLQTSNSMHPWDAAIKGRTVMGNLWRCQTGWKIRICIWVNPVDRSISPHP